MQRDYTSSLIAPLQHFFRELHQSQQPPTLYDYNNRRNKIARQRAVNLMDKQIKHHIIKNPQWLKYAVLILFLTCMGLNKYVLCKTPSPNSNEKIEITTSPMDNACPADSKLPKITLVLGGGGCKALAQIGVLKVFERNHIPINYIVGTSAGAII